MGYVGTVRLQKTVSTAARLRLASSCIIAVDLRWNYVCLTSPWHFNNREVGEGAHGAPCDMNVGAVVMEKVVTKLAEMGRNIQQQQQQQQPPREGGRGGA
eukprot:COSAG02_NODE_8109_length_2706_cov_1.925201_2_plen_100_part_00